MKLRPDILAGIVSWFDRVTEGGQPSNDRCFSFQLTHYGDGRGPEPLCPASIATSLEALDILGPEGIRERVQKAAEYFLSTAETVASRHKRQQEFRIQGYANAERTGDASSQYIFDVQRANRDPYADHEDASERGQTSQLQRHAERLIGSLDTRERERNRATEKALELLKEVAQDMQTEVRQSRVEMRELYKAIGEALDIKRRSEVDHARGMLRVGVEKAGYEYLFGQAVPMLMDRFGVGTAGQLFRDLLTNPKTSVMIRSYMDSGEMPEEMKAKLDAAMGTYFPGLASAENEAGNVKVGETNGVAVKSDAEAPNG